MSPPQNMVALADGQQVRMAGVSFRREVGSLERRSGLLVLAEALEPARVSRHVGAVTLIRHLCAARRVGPGVARAICAAAGLIRDPGTTYVRDLNLRERSALAAELRRLAGEESP